MVGWRSVHLLEKSLNLTGTGRTRAPRGSPDVVDGDDQSAADSGYFMKPEIKSSPVRGVRSESTMDYGVPRWGFSHWERSEEYGGDWCIGCEEVNTIKNTAGGEQFEQAGNRINNGW